MACPSTSFTEVPRLPRAGRIVSVLVRARKRRDVRGAMAWIAVVVALVESAGLFYPKARALALSLEETPAARGQRLTASLGCFSCHGPAACPIHTARPTPAIPLPRRTAQTPQRSPLHTPKLAV